MAKLLQGYQNLWRCFRYIHCAWLMVTSLQPLVVICGASGVDKSKLEFDLALGLVNQGSGVATNPDGYRPFTYEH